MGRAGEMGGEKRCGQGSNGMAGGIDSGKVTALPRRESAPEFGTSGQLLEWVDRKHQSVRAAVRNRATEAGPGAWRLSVFRLGGGSGHMASD